MDDDKSCKKYIFDFDWKIVMKALWDKYPNKIFDFVKYDRVVEFRKIDEYNYYIKKVKHCQKFGFMWAYFIEDVNYNLKDKKMISKAVMVQKCSLFPLNIGEEDISYESLKEKINKTIYFKHIKSTGMEKFLSKFNDSYKNGIELIKEKCKNFFVDNDN